VILNLHLVNLPQLKSAALTSQRLHFTPFPVKLKYQPVLLKPRELSTITLHCTTLNWLKCQSKLLSHRKYLLQPYTVLR
jgi:hypothetical protein